MTDKRTVLHAEHLALGARMVPFGGWDMPVQYAAGVKAEHAAVRQQAGLFDVSHMGNVVLRGSKIGAALDRLTTWPMSKLAAGAAKYTVFPNLEGGTVDDLIVYKRRDDEYFIIWNASNHAKNLVWTAPVFKEFGVDLEDLTDTTALIALQGPAWEAAFKKVLPKAPLPQKRFTFSESDGVTVVRTGYTGEDGVEIWLPNDRAVALWRGLIDAGVQPCGLGARDSLRIEAGLPLYGHELTDEIGAVEGGVGFVVKKDHSGYLGQAKLQLNPARRLVGIRLLDKGVPREGYEVLDAQQKPIGKVTSGSYSPIIDSGIGLALVSLGQSRYDGASLDGFISIRGRPAAAKLVKPPIHKS